MDIRNCLRFYDEDDLSELKIKYPKTAQSLIELASYEFYDTLTTREMNDLLEYVNGNGFNITYDDTTKRYIVKREEKIR